jgi:hypothetical protein
MKDVMFSISVIWLLIRERRNYDAVYFLMQGLKHGLLPPAGDVRAVLPS